MCHAWMHHKEVSHGTTEALPPNLDLSSHQFTTNGGGDGFPPARSDGITTEVHTDQLDLSSVSFSFTTEDPAVQSARMLLVSEPGDGLFRLDIFEHGRRCSNESSRGGSQRLQDVQQYLNRLRDFDFRTFSIEKKQAVAKMVNRLFDAGGLDSPASLIQNKMDG